MQDSSGNSPPPYDHDSTSLAAELADIEKRLERTSDALATLQSQTSEPPASHFRLEQLEAPAADATVEHSPAQPLEFLSDVELDLRIELGRTEMSLQEILQLRGGSVVALNELVGDPVNVYVNNRLVARGEILVIDDNFSVRVLELVSGE